MHHVVQILEVPLSNIFAWTVSRATLRWLQGNPQRFLTFVGKWAAEIPEAIPAACWRHVEGAGNPADYTSRGIFPAELVEHNLCKRGPQWVRKTKEIWNEVPLGEHPVPSEERDVQQTLFQLSHLI